MTYTICRYICWSLYDQSVISLWSVCDQSVVSLWSVCDQSVVSLWSVCDQSVVSLWSVCSSQSVASLYVVMLFVVSLMSVCMSVSSISLLCVCLFLLKLSYWFVAMHLHCFIVFLKFCILLNIWECNHGYIFVGRTPHAAVLGREHGYTTNSGQIGKWHLV